MLKLDRFSCSQKSGLSGTHLYKQMTVHFAKGTNPNRQITVNEIDNTATSETEGENSECCDFHNYDPTGDLGF